MLTSRSSLLSHLSRFFDARDAIVQADKILTGGDNACEIWTAFTERGLVRLLSFSLSLLFDATADLPSCFRFFLRSNRDLRLLFEVLPLGEEESESRTTSFPREFARRLRRSSSKLGRPSLLFFVVVSTLHHHHHHHPSASTHPFRPVFSLLVASVSPSSFPFPTPVSLSFSPVHLP